MFRRCLLQSKYCTHYLSLKIALFIILNFFSKKKINNNAWDKWEKGRLSRFLLRKALQSSNEDWSRQVGIFWIRICKGFSFVVVINLTPTLLALFRQSELQKLLSDPLISIQVNDLDCTYFKKKSTTYKYLKQLPTALRCTHIGQCAFNWVTTRDRINTFFFFSRNGC